LSNGGGESSWFNGGGEANQSRPAPEGAADGRSPSTPLGRSVASIPNGSPSRHVLLSPPPPPLGTLGRRPRFKTRVIPRSAEIDAAEAQLDNALLAVIGGSPAGGNSSSSSKHSLAILLGH
jgi:hypothetical protein